MKSKIMVAALIALLGQSAFAAQSYIVIGHSDKGADKLAANIAAAGGVVTETRLQKIGVLVAESDNADFASMVGGAMGVFPNIEVQMIEPTENVAVDASNPPNSGDDDFFFDRQWGHDAVNAPEAWNAGVRGEGALVAVLDGGFSLAHADIAGQVAGAADMTGEGIEYGPNVNDASGIFSHGMHVAGTIAAADNGFGTIGVAPDADLLLVKVLGNRGSGSFADVMSGILFAADFGGVDIINMSLGADIPQGLGADAAGVAALRVALGRAVTYAHQQGILVIVAAGNDGRDLDKDKSMVVFPADMPHALSISATAPRGWGFDPNTNLDQTTFYTNYGRSGVDFAAPGGGYDFAFESNDAFGPCTVAGATRSPCYVWDYVFSSGALVGTSNYYYWSVGTSMAAPHAAGVAALIVSENGGQMHPAQLKAEMASRAADLGQPGNDPQYGGGRVSSGY